MKKLGTLIILLGLVISCNSTGESNLDVSYDEAELEGSSIETSMVTLEKQEVPADRKIIWSADLEFQVVDVDTATKKISDLCEKYGAFISNMNMNSTNYEVSNRITIRVDNNHFNELINEIKGTSTFIRKVEINSNDVTEEFVDIESRLKTKKEVRERYIDILRNKAGEVKDVIAAEEAIRVITEEIEAKEGRLRFLQNKVSQSTINLEIYQKVDYKSEPETFEKGFFTKAKDSLATGWEIILEVFLFALRIWPLLIISMVLIIWRKKWFRKKRG